MHVYYCRKCKQDSVSPVCEHCGVQITSVNQNERFRWKSVRVPLGDSATVGSVLRALVITLLLLSVFLFVGEMLFAHDKRMAIRLMTMDGALPWLLAMLCIAMGIALLVLGLQGPEEIHFVLDARGAHRQTWIVPGRLKCIARCIPYDETRIVPGPDGDDRMMIGESHLVWTDVCRYEVKKRAGRIDLYCPSGFRFMSLTPETEEFDAVAQYISPKLKHLGKK